MTAEEGCTEIPGGARNDGKKQGGVGLTRASKQLRRPMGSDQGLRARATRGMCWRSSTKRSEFQPASSAAIASRWP